MSHKKPGDLSDELKTALGMPTGTVCVYIYVCVCMDIYIRIVYLGAGMDVSV